MFLFNSAKPKLKKTISGKQNKRRRPGCLLVLGILFLFILIEGIRAKRDWDKYKNHWEAKGEIFDLEKLIPPNIPDRNNFAASPIISELFNDNVTHRLKNLALNEIPGLQQPGKAALSSPTNRFHRRALGTTPYPLIDYLSPPNTISNENEAAKFILEQLEPLDFLFKELDEASKLPLAKFPLKYDNSLTMEYEYGKLLQGAVKTLALRSRAQLAMGNSQAAMLDLLGVLRLAELTGSEPTIISHIIQSSFCKISISVLHFGLEKNLFATNDLISIQAALKSQKLESRLVLALRTDRAMTISLIDSCHEGRAPAFDNNAKKSTSTNRILRILWYLRISTPFAYRNKLNYSKFIQEHGLSTKEKVNLERINFDTITDIKTDLKALKDNSFLPINPYSVFVHLLVTPHDIVATGASQTAARIDLARVAIALELYRREHGSYPATLAALAPNYLDSVPADLITGDPLHYRIKPDGTPIIYSVGLNKTDDGGLLKRDRALGDWVWQYTLPADFNEKDWWD